MDALINVTDEKLVVAKTAIVGFGFSCIPLLRELDISEEPYIIISDKVPSSVWSELEKNNRLDFDLVSSYYTSWYSFDIVKNPKGDYYPTAKDFYEMHKSYYEKYKNKIISAHISQIDNYDGFSILHSDDGRKFKVENVVITCGFKRKVLNSLVNFDYNVKNKTIVFDTIGDSSNLMISKLIAGYNKIICVTNGFLSFDKMFIYNGKPVTLDQLEFHTLGKYRKRAYRAFVMGDPFHLTLVHLTGIKRKVSEILGAIFLRGLLGHKHPETRRKEPVDPKRFYRAKPVPNGIIAIKYWPIDTYYKLFHDNLEESITKGYLLNDITLWIDLGYVEILKKDDTHINLHKNTIINNGKEIPYDYLIQGDPETPKIPTINIMDKNGEMKSVYSYAPKDNYLGVIPYKLSNVFIAGSIRPTTGGLANITEMQGLLIHKMIVNSDFKNSIYSSIFERIKNYNMQYYLNDRRNATDHLVHYGFYTEEVAKVLNIDIKFKDCKTWKEFITWAFFPNNAFKYRQTGEYKVEGCDRLVESIDKLHDRWEVITKAIMLNICIN